jgi:methylthioribose-1-phosphate isomerase
MVDFRHERTVAWTDDTVVLIDQTQLPQRFTHLVCRRAEDVAEAIQRMVVRGAPAIGVAAAMGLVLATVQSRATTAKSLLADLERAGDLLRRTRPTAVNLSWAVERVLRKARQRHEPEAMRRVVREEALRMAEEDIRANQRMGRYGAALLEDGDRVLTHCSTGTLATVGYGTALGVIRAARAQGKCIHVYTTETRPALQGARLNAYELREDGADVTLIADTMVGHCMRTGRVKKVITGADRITRTGHVFNKIGTYQLAVLAARHTLPFYVAAPWSTFDLRNGWEQVVIEERHVDEVVKVRGRRIAPKGVSVFNPAFDMTPPELVSALVTERGVLHPPLAQAIDRVA